MDPSACKTWLKANVPNVHVIAKRVRYLWSDVLDASRNTGRTGRTRFSELAFED
jgi:hypothetical protein